MIEDEVRLSRALVARMTTARRVWWMFVGAAVFYGVVTVAQLVIHRGTG